MKQDRIVLDFSNSKVRRMVIDHIKSARGLCWFELARCRNQRSLQQNAYYWGCVLKVVQQAINESWGESMSAHEVHEFLKGRFLRKSIVNKNTGEIVGDMAGSSSDLDTKQFTDFIENVRNFAASMFDIIVPNPADYRETD